MSPVKAALLPLMDALSPGAVVVGCRVVWQCQPATCAAARWARNDEPPASRTCALPAAAARRRRSAGSGLLAPRSMPARCSRLSSVIDPGVRQDQRCCGMILLIDNYDSFTFNLYHVLGEAALRTGPYHCDVWRNDKLSVEQALAMQPEAIILSPGPCTPNEAGICL